MCHIRRVIAEFEAKLGNTSKAGQMPAKYGRFEFEQPRILTSGVNLREGNVTDKAGMRRSVRENRHNDDCSDYGTA